MNKSMENNTTFPSQKLPFRRKNKAWREACVDWASNKTYFTHSPVRKSVVQMKINYDLLNGIIHMEDVAKILNPGNISTAFVPDKIQHYPIINSKLNTLRGEEAARVFDWKVIVTNPYSISQIEEEKRAQFDQLVQNIVEDQTLSQQDAEKQLQEGKEFFDTSYQDKREIRANELMRHYQKEYNIKQIFNDGFMDACTVGTEAYQCGIVGGEPFITRLNPMKLRAFGTGYSDRLEDADVIIYEDYWSRGRIIDTYYDELSSKDIKWLSDEIPEFGGQSPTTPEGAYNEAYPFIPAHAFEGEDGILLQGSGGVSFFYDALPGYEGGIGSNLLPYDVAGNVRVLRVWWKSKRKIYKVKSFDPVTGEEVLDFYPETYVADTDAGEEAPEVFRIRQALRNGCHTLPVQFILLLMPSIQAVQVVVPFRPGCQHHVFLICQPCLSQIGILIGTHVVESVIPADCCRVRFKYSKLDTDQDTQNQEEYFRLAPQGFAEAHHAAGCRCSQQAEYIQYPVKLFIPVCYIHPDSNVAERCRCNKQRSVQQRLLWVFTDTFFCLLYTPFEPFPSMNSEQEHSGRKQHHCQHSYPLQRQSLVHRDPFILSPGCFDLLYSEAAFHDQSDLSV